MMTHDHLWLAKTLTQNSNFKNCRHMLVILARNGKRLRVNGT